MTKSNVKPFAILSFLLALSLLPGCQGEPASSGSKPSSDSGKKLKIAVIPKGTTHVFWKSVNFGAQKAADELGVEILFQGPQKEDDRDQQISLVQSLTIKGVDGICLAPLDSQALVRSVEEAAQANIPTVVFDSGLDAPGKFVSYVATDNRKGGQLAAEKMATDLGGKGRVVLLRYNQGSESTYQREEGFLEKIKEYPQIEVLTSDQYAGTTVMSALDKAQQVIQRFDGKVDGIFAVCEPNADGVLRALEDMSLSGKVVFVGFDPSERLRTALKEKRMNAIVLQDPVNMGYQAVKTIVRHLRGEKVEDRVDTGQYVATPENMDADPIKSLLDPPKL